MKRFLLFPLILLFGCSSPAVLPALPPARSVQTVTINGTPRSYILRFPKAYDGKAKLPLVMLIHGATDSAAYAEKAYHFVEAAEAGRFVLVMPDALGEYHVWNGLVTKEEPRAGKDDLDFLTAVLEDLPKRYAIDAKRVYVCGHSSGAIMTYRLITERPDLVTAAGIVAGSVGDSDSFIPKAKGAVPLIVFHGKKDETVAYGEEQDGAVARAMAFWTKANGCEGSPTVTDRPVATVQRDMFVSRLANHADIVLYSLDNGNHMWPGGVAMPGKTVIPVQDISATELMCAFFGKHVRE